MYGDFSDIIYIYILYLTTEVCSVCVCVCVCVCVFSHFIDQYILSAASDNYLLIIKRVSIRVFVFCSCCRNNVECYI